MRPISRPQKVLASARWKLRLGPPRSDRSIEEPGAVGGEQVLVDQLEVVKRLLAGSTDRR